MNSMMMSEFNSLEQILAYVAKNILKTALEAKVKHMVVEVNEVEIFDMGKRINIEPKPPDEPRSADMHLR